MHGFREAVKIAEICKISRNSINKILKEIRKLMASECEKISKMKGEIELDESYFGGKRGRGAKYIKIEKFFFQTFKFTQS